MSDETAQEARVQELFLTLLDVEEAERSRVLAELESNSTLRAIVLERLAQDARTATRLRPLESPLGDSREETEESTTVGGARSYRLIRELGAGGMGSVWLAEREDGDLRLRVALKRLLPGRVSDQVLQRFRAERQILASLDHPGIAKVLDGGTSDNGLPFLAMEYIEGAPIDRYCQEKRLGTRERVALVHQVALAVGAAHQRLIVHRDIKPGNILVGADGHPKLLDFGIAKLLDKESFEFTVAETGAGLSPLTLNYASPEQIRGDAIDTATDIYSLGVLLFKLLTGRLPYPEAPSIPALAHSILTLEAPAPSSVAATEPDALPRAELRGDLDAIVLRALQKPKAERYPSMAAFADDLWRYLEGWPVSARQGTAFYRASKLVRRYRLQFGATALAFGLLVGATLWSRQQAARLAAERDRVAAAEAEAREQATTARQVTTFLVEILSGADPVANRGRQPELRELLDRGATRVSEELEGQPQVEAALLEAIGTIYDHLGNPARALPLLEKAVALRGQFRASEAEAYATARGSLASALRSAGDNKAAIEHLRAAVAILDGQLGANHEKTSLLRIQLGNLLLSQEGLTEEAVGLVEAAPQIELARRGLTALPADLSGLTETSQLCQAFTARGNLDLYRGHAEGALAWYRDALRLAELRETDEPTRVATLHISLALALMDLGRNPEALDELGIALALRTRIFGPGHPELLGVLANRAAVYFNLGDYAASVADSLAAEEIAARISPVHPALWAARSNRAEALEKQGHVDEAIALHLAVLEMENREKGAEHEGAVIGHMNVASLFGARRRFPEALHHIELAIAIADKILPADHPYRANSRITLGQIQVSRGQTKEAEHPLRAALQILGDRADQASLRAEGRFLLAQVLATRNSGQAEALGLAREAVELWRSAGNSSRAAEAEAWLRAKT